MSDRTNPTPRPSRYELDLWARHQRSIVMAAYLRSAVAGMVALVRSLARACIGLAQRIAAEKRLWDDIRMFQQFDDRMLADIGISRGEIEHVVRYGRSTFRPSIAPTPRRRRLHPAAIAAKAGTGIDRRMAVVRVPKR